MLRADEDKEVVKNKDKEEYDNLKESIEKIVEKHRDALEKLSKL